MDNAGEFGVHGDEGVGVAQDGACTLDQDVYNLKHNPEKQIIWKSKWKPIPRSAFPLATVVNDDHQRFRQVYQSRSAFPLATVLKCDRPKARRAKLVGPSGNYTSTPSPEGMPTSRASSNPTKQPPHPKTTHHPIRILSHPHLHLHQSPSYTLTPPSAATTASPLPIGSPNLSNPPTKRVAEGDSSRGRRGQRLLRRSC
ncbi:hypothetical protein QJS10_CPB14g00714 [Acorus calamus]|uniref:Uncharacterized protein n=1 Tax=Acorus calamus TaxID=4465 RepID=A0AAV9DEN1_ACOCL|nr:hypothetical protein QJS10_CPB14g00714 [Acorus calamus]